MSSRNNLLYHFIGLALLSLVITGCGSPRPGGLFKKRSPHEVYAQRLKEAGLNETAMGKAWLQKADSSLRMPVTISIPYRETGYFAADRVEAASFRFEARRGEKLSVSLRKKPLNDFMIFVDLLEGDTSVIRPEVLAFADTSGAPLSYEVEESGHFMLRLQPELLQAGEYTLDISYGPSLGYPLKAPGSGHIQSIWGDERDAGARRHEGIDLFVPLRTPVLAAAPGRVSSVKETPLGGKVVWLRPENRNYRLYYAHLDSQLVQDGQQVQAGEIIGLVGNSGNARNTPPHLHFGIYTFGGAVDPFPFVNRNIRPAAGIKASLENLNKTVRTRPGETRFFSSPDAEDPDRMLPAQTPLLVEAATSDLYKVILPDGRKGYIRGKSVHPIKKALSNRRLEAAQPLLAQPALEAVRKAVLPTGSPVDILGSFNNYFLVSDRHGNSGWIER